MSVSSSPRLRRRITICAAVLLLAGAGSVIALNLTADRRPKLIQAPSPSPSDETGCQDHAVAGTVLRLLSDKGLVQTGDHFHDYEGVVRSATGWTIYFDGPDCETSADAEACLEDSADRVSVESRFAGPRMRIADISAGFGAEAQDLVGEDVPLSLYRSTFSLGAPILERSQDAVSVQAPFFWSGPIPSEARPRRGCSFELWDAQGTVGTSPATFRISPPTSESDRDGVLQDTIPVDPTLPRSRALDLNLDCLGGGRLVRPSGLVCTEGIGGAGNEVQEYYPPKPDFEVFNMWTGSFESECLHVVAGRQQDRDISGPGLQEPHYVDGGTIEIFGGYLKPNRIEWFESDLPHPIRLVDYRPNGDDVELIVQSLADCSLEAFGLE